MDPGHALLEVEDLHVHFNTSRGVVRAVEGVSYTIRSGEIFALVGESGCGKSVSALSIMRLLAKPAGRVARGRILFEGRDLLRCRPCALLRGPRSVVPFARPAIPLALPVLILWSDAESPFVPLANREKD